MSRVFILYKNALFAHGLERLLGEEGQEVVGRAMSRKHALKEIGKLNPDVIITEVEGKTSDAGMLITQLLRKLPQVTIVRLSLEDNTAQLYTGRCWTANTGQDLVRGMLSSAFTARRWRRHVYA